MAELIEFETDRLSLRQWLSRDRDPFFELNSDPKVMEYLPSLLTREERDRMADKCHSLITERGWGFWAAELKESNQFVGFVGLHIPSDQLPFSPCVEIGWRLAYQHWGKGLATEAANGALNVAFEVLHLREIVAFTAVGNYRSRAVMERLRMQESGTFDHHQVPEGSALRKHCLYRLAYETRDA